MRKLTLLNLAGASILATALLGATPSFAKTSFAKKVDANVIKTSELAPADVIHYPESQLYQKPGAPIRYSYTIPKTIEIGQTVTFDLRVTEPFQSGNLQVSSTVRGDVSVISNSGNDDFSMASGSSHDMKVTFVANSAGRHYIQFQAVSNTAEGSRVRAFSIPVQVGPKQPLPPHPGLTTTPSGQKVISLKATEVIR